MQQELFKGRDKRKKGWFWMDNEYLNGWAKHFGATGTAIYVSLCRHADNETQQCFPAQKTIAEELSVDERTVRRYLSKFEKCRLISIMPEKDPLTKKRLNNIYTLLDKEHWMKPEDIMPSGKPEDIKDRSQRTKASGHHAPSKETKEKETHNKEVALKKATLPVTDFINLFKAVNPSYEELFKNKTEREAAERLLRKYGFEKIAASVKALPAYLEQKGCPQITTPWQMEKKLGQLIFFVKQQKPKEVHIIE